MKNIFTILSVLSIVFFSTNSCEAQLLGTASQSKSQDSLRGSLNANRTWWDVQRYDITFEPQFDTKTIKGKNIITYKVISDKQNRLMQIDLQENQADKEHSLKITKILYDNKAYIEDPGFPIKRNGHVYTIPMPGSKLNSIHQISIEYEGTPRIGKNPPWDGGCVWKTDNQSRPFFSIACQGLGASVWYPCKDHQSDEPDKGASLTIIAPNELTAVGNGKLLAKTPADNYKTAWKWEVTNPINNYDIIPNIAHYVNIKDVYHGEKGDLQLSYWVLDYNEEIAKKHFGEDVKPMLKCFEEWLGPYPFYEDDYKLVETPYLGMEHQSNVAYGNKYKKGYLGSDRSGSGWGNDWDYIIIHETGHEWFGNNITTNDIADMWIHEGFTTYTEALFVECKHGKKAADEYINGIKKNISNRANIIGKYGINEEGSGDMYDKGANLIHLIRSVINNDIVFKKVLRGLNENFYHKTVTTQEIEKYISDKIGFDFSKVFEQYLRNINIPQLETKITGNKVEYRWINCIAGFNLPVKLANSETWLNPTTEWQSIEIDLKGATEIKLDKNFYVKQKSGV